MSNNKGWIGVDLDGTLAQYDGYKGPTHIGEPITRMVERVKRWLDQGKEVRIFTARVHVPTQPENPGDEWYARALEVEQARFAIAEWCHDHIGSILPITCEKDYGMYVLYDDRAKQIVPNTGFCIDGSDLISHDDENGFLMVRTAILGRGFYKHEVDLIKVLLDNATVPDPA